MVGKWVLTSFGLKSLSDVGLQSHLSREDHVLLLRGDGSCSVRTILGLPGDRHQYRAYESGCAWRLGKVGHQALELQLSPEPPSGNPNFYFAEEQGRLIIWQHAADPDAWRYLEFERAGE
jgi:hypothetical protein